MYGEKKHNIKVLEKNKFTFKKCESVANRHDEIAETDEFD